MSAALGKELPSPPKDGVSSLEFYADSALLLACSWDGTARVYDTSRPALHATYGAGSPVLDAAWENEGVIYTGGLDASVKRYDLYVAQETLLGLHTAGVRCVEYIPSRNLLATAAWDSTLRLWDSRAAGGQGMVARIQLPGRAFTMSTSDTKLVVGTSGRMVDIYDLRTLEGGQPEQRRESSLRYQTRCLRCSPNGQGYALASVEGRVAMELFDPSPEAQTRKYAFKCHRKSEGGRDVVYPVNSIAFNQKWGTFVTGGCDGVVNIWDGENKKRLHQVAGYPTSVAALAFNADATRLAVAASYTYEQGERDHPLDAIFLREMHEVEVKPKTRPPPAA